ncbi:DUF4913 domain-containing protein [Rhodococcoides fascians]|uniref:DUF4913 domain-containing protein n=1 Tax=Rhodococcoides fascians TaxID=1828 RepID=UPI000B03241F|nr:MULTISPECIES: DUF4913 domain-containing protein [Rhodococcus]
MSDDEFDPATELAPPGDDSEPGGIDHDDVDADGERPISDDGGAVGDDELSAPFQQQVDAAVSARIRKEVAAIADAQFGEILTPELFGQLQAATARALAATLDTEVQKAQAAADDAEAAPVYTSLLDFVDEVIRPHYRREVSEGNQKKWCPQWWAHGEAYRRLDALWRAWEHLRKDPNTGASVWWKDHADHHMGMLLDPQGPFSACGVRHGHKTTLPPLPADEPDPALFAIPADPDTAAVGDVPPPADARSTTTAIEGAQR